MTTFCISSGHGKYIRGASGYPVPPQLDEVDQARVVVEEVAEYLRLAGDTVYTFHDNTSHDQSTNLSTITSWHNSKSRDYDVSVHFNAYDGSAHGCEVLYVTQQTLAAKVSEAIAEAGDFTNRGAKYRSDLYVLNNTEEPAILIETCFCDNTGDSTKYNDNLETICRMIAEALSGQSISERPPEQPPEGERPPLPQPPQTGTVHNLAPNDVLNIRASASSSSPIIGIADNDDLLTVVGYAMNGDTKYYKCKWGDDHMAGVAVYGFASAAYVAVDAPVDPIDQGWHDDIEATEFGGGSDHQDSAYPDIDWINDTTRGVALPYKWKETPRPRVVVKGPKGEVETDIVDLGPWNLDDPDYCLGSARPLSESQYENHTEAQNGQVPTNKAGIDLTPPIADAVGISGKGSVAWRFADAGNFLSQGKSTSQMDTGARAAVQFFAAGKSDQERRSFPVKRNVHPGKRDRSNPARHGKGGARSGRGHKPKGRKS